MRPIEQIYETFSGAPKPAASEIVSGSDDDERREISRLLAGYAARELPDPLLARYPLSTMFPMLSHQAYRYYMPRCIEHCLETPDSLLCESLMFSLSTARDEHIRHFAVAERAAVREFIEHVASLPDSSFIKEQLDSARKLWGR